MTRLASLLQQVDWTCAFSTMYMANLTSLSAVMELRDLYLKPTGEGENPELLVSQHNLTF